MNSIMLTLQSSSVSMVPTFDRNVFLFMSTLSEIMSIISMQALFLFFHSFPYRITSFFAVSISSSVTSYMSPASYFWRASFFNRLSCFKRAISNFS